MKKIKLRTSDKWKNLLLHKTLDLLIVILGITIAFQLGKIKEKSDKLSLEHFYLQNFAQDIDKDISTMIHISKELQSDLGLTKQYLAQHAAGILSLDTLGQVVVNILSFETFNFRNDNTYTTLINGNGLSIIKDENIRSLITEYYKSYKSIDRFEDVYTEFLLNNFHPFFSSQIDYTTEKINSTASIEDIEINNNLLIAQGQLDEGLDKYNLALKKAFALKEKLDKEVLEAKE